MDTAHMTTERRPWGEFRKFVENEKVTVKIILVVAGEEFSLQEHHHRSEFWHIISGTPEVTIGETTVNAKAGDEFTIPVGSMHRMKAVGGDATFLEISSGEFDENDIVRMKDDYGRA